MIIQSLQQTINSGSQTFPIYIGFVKASDLLKIATVPNFNDNTPNKDIADNILTPPVLEWQRPLISEVRDNIINTFNGTGDLCPILCLSLKDA